MPLLSKLPRFLADFRSNLVTEMTLLATYETSRYAAHDKPSPFFVQRVFVRPFCRPAGLVAHDRLFLEERHCTVEIALPP
jgi:hypothetical protein